MKLNESSDIISFIRLIRDLDTTSQLGVLVINIQRESLAQAYDNLLNEDAFQVAILDENNEIIVANSRRDKQRHDIIHDVVTTNKELLEQQWMQRSYGFLTLSSGSQQYTVSYLADGDHNWKIINANPTDFIDDRNKAWVLGILILLIVNGAIFFISSCIISNSIIKPIHKLLRAMNKATTGNLRRVNVEPNSYELEQLFIGYNEMITQIEQMVNTIVEEQNTIRKAELGALQAQIKPHFLYNTLDSITSLAMSGLNEEVCELLEALGSYYRLSVSKGREIITVGEEVEIVRNYLKIQKVRYPNLFEVKFDVDDCCLPVLIPKLVLQPLVENCLYHGIRPKGDTGNIHIEVKTKEEGVQLVISDDGIGMSQDEISEILYTERKGQIKSFGLWGTKERLRIYYRDVGGFSIISEPNKGTSITLLIPSGGDMSWEN
ncbi:Sensor histidine kinase YpdA [compost metagenome]